MSKVKEDLKYTLTHEWVNEVHNNECYIGITDYAQEALGDLVFINLPEVGDAVEAGKNFADVESVKAVSEIFSPVSGTVIEINEALLDNAALINEDPYGAWIIKVGDITERENLIDSESYKNSLGLAAE